MFRLTNYSLMLSDMASKDTCYRLCSYESRRELVKSIESWKLLRLETINFWCWGRHNLIIFDWFATKRKFSIAFIKGSWECFRSSYIKSKKNSLQKFEKHLHNVSDCRIVKPGLKVNENGAMPLVLWKVFLFWFKQWRFIVPYVNFWEFFYFWTLPSLGSWCMTQKTCLVDRGYVMSPHDLRNVSP